MTTATLPRLANQAVAARGGADLYRFAFDARIPDTAFAKNGDGSITIKGLDLCKVGIFNGLQLSDADLAAMVEHFEQLRDAGIFLPPFRLDHSWSVLDVIGYFADLSTYRRTDETDGVEKLFLAGDVLLTGSLDHKPEVLVAAIKRGALRNRSSEIGFYVTNAGTELPLVFYGAAFVDIPAVEGLAPISLRARRAEPHSITNLNAPTEETPTMDPTKLARLKVLRALKGGTAALSAAQDGELDGLEAEATAAGVTDEDVEAAGPEAPDDDGTADDDEPAADPPAAPGTPDPAAPPADPVVDPPVVDPPAADPPADDDTSPEAQLARANAEITRLRASEHERTVAALRASGAITEGNADDAVALLSHADEDVRRRAGAILGGIPAVVKLGKRPGRTSTDDGKVNAGTGGTLGLKGMTGGDGGALWAGLTSEQRVEHKAEYDAWVKYRQENGIRD